MSTSDQPFQLRWSNISDIKDEIHRGVDLNTLKRLKKLRSWMLCWGILGLLSSCTSISRVAPWEKGYLAKPEMTFEVDVLDQNFTEHTYFSKEGSFGGAGVGGGGCGCN